MFTEMIAHIDNAQEELKQIDLRSLRSPARDVVKAARQACADAKTAVRAAQTNALIPA